MTTQAEINSAAEKNIQENEKKKKEEEREIEEKSDPKKNKNSEKNEKISFSQILPISDNRKFETENEPRSSNQGAIPWWERIMSNRH